MGETRPDETEDKAELQRQMEDARESISETVAEIKSVVAHQYEEVKEKVETVKAEVGEVLDWRTEFERNPLVWGAGAVSVGILIGFGIARALDDEDEPKRRGRRGPSKGEKVVAELGGFADAVLPTISAKVKELFGLDLDAYLRAAHEERRPARKRVAKKAGAKKRAAKPHGGGKSSTRKRGAGRRSRER
ncbi:MAG: hypothetical protein M3444_09060 [Acidobacteriota bacterium]|nr:hypothetical protein [Acidobacteriota bacterium]MDQ5838971.1 hypothetical protein [Acidobacteriota bacterium]